MITSYFNNPPAKYKALIVSAAYALVAVSLASSLYGFYESTKQVGTSLPVSSAASAQPHSSLDMQSTLTAGWFGSEEALQNIGNPHVVLELKGISASDKTKLAGAYIAEPNKPELFYHEGDKLPANAGKLSKVYSDHVLIERAGNSYTLAFPSTKSAKPSD